ncbi:MAG: hypothetical protein M1820_004951 [Bogoriella megaspora]|nr:MAG: hypothetical protein M1820_004951 [Bogoriella megaspora]
MYLTRREESHVAVPSRFAGQPLATSPYSSVPPDAGVRISPVPQQVRSYATYPPYPSQGRTPQYGQAANGTPVNMSNGAVRTEARGVFISGLPFTTKKTDLENALRRYGRLVKCELPPHQSKAGMARGTATAEFTTLEAAETAVLNFNSYGGRQIKVRFDRESTKSGPLAEEPPIVLNGSTGGSGSAY